MPPPRTSRRWWPSRRSDRPSTTSSPTPPTSRSRSRELMRSITTVIVGAGHAGLAMSRCLSDRSIDHVLLERGEVARSWSTGRWDSLRLLTPSWQSRLPGHRYTGPDPDGFMTMPEVIEMLRGYAGAIDAPVETHTEVLSVRACDEGFLVTTTRGMWRCRTVVLANGACGIPDVPALAGDL